MCVNIIYVCICLYCVICLILYYRSLLICTNKEFMNSNNRCRWTETQKSKANYRLQIRYTRTTFITSVLYSDLEVETCGYNRHSGALMVLSKQYLVSSNIPGTAHDEPLIVP